MPDAGPDLLPERTEEVGEASATASGQLERNVIGVPGIVFLVLAAVAPMAAVVAVIPLGIALGNGVGFPGSYLFASVVLFGFAAGYAAMSHHVVNAGAFYAYITRGLGRPAGLAAAFVAVLAYNALMFSIAGGFGFFANAVFVDQFGIDLPWQAWVGIAFGLSAVVGYRKIDVSARILGVALVLEVLAITVVDIAVLADVGVSALPTESFGPDAVLAGAPGAALMFALFTFVGFEATAIFGEESRDPRRTVPRATFAALGIAAVFYLLTSWTMIAAYGAEGAQEAAAKDPGVFVFGASQTYVGSLWTDLMQILVVTSLFAALLAVHNATARYMFALGRDGLLPKALGRTHDRFGSPYVASLTQIGLAVIVVGAFAVAGADPYLLLATSMGGLGTLGVVALQSGAALSVVVFFRRRRDRRWLTTLVAPLIGCIGLGVAVGLGLDNYSYLTGRESGIVNQLPWLLLVAALAGVVNALWLRGARPDRYARMARSLEAGDGEPRVELGRAEAPVFPSPPPA